MQIETRTMGRHTVLYLTGRLDISWADHFLQVSQEVIRGGRHHLRVEASGLDYLSSAGIRVLIRLRQELAAVTGSFFIVNPSPFVYSTLRMSGLELLLASQEEITLTDGVAETPADEAETHNTPAEMGIEVFALDAAARMRVQSPCSWKPWQPIKDIDIIKLSFPLETVGFGIGAPARNPRDARSQLGEFLALSGCLSWLPGGGENTPDYLVLSEKLIPEVYAVQALTAEGAFSHLLRFSPNDKTSSINLTELIGAALKTVREEAVVMVAVAEAEGLVGAALSRSPGEMREEETPGHFPEIRDWMAFCGERVHARQSVLLAAVAARGPSPEMAACLTATPSDPSLFLHAHAAVLPFRPLQEGCLPLHKTVQAFFETAEPMDLMHLIEDNRPLLGLGQSAFLRGACWCAPLRFEKEGGV